MATLTPNTLNARIEAAADEYRSGRGNTVEALAKVKRLIRAKVQSAELQRQLDIEEGDAPSCP